MDHQKLKRAEERVSAWARKKTDKSCTIIVGSFVDCKDQWPQTLAGWVNWLFNVSCTLRSTCSLNSLIWYHLNVVNFFGFCAKVNMQGYNFKEFCLLKIISNTFKEISFNKIISRDGIKPMKKYNNQIH